MGITFGKWDAELHTSADQQKRIARAQKSDTTPDSIDKETHTGIFAGSGKLPYNTTLDSCTCGDFSRRRQPCKHIYRLAMECGLFEGKPQKGVNKNVEMHLQITLEQAVEIIENLSDSKQKVIQNLLYLTIYRGESFVTVDSDDEFLHCSLITVAKVPPERILAKWKKGQLTALLNEHNILFAKSARKTDLVTLCVDKIDGIDSILPALIDLSFVDKFKNARRSLYTYLNRKFDWEYFYNPEMQEMRYPHGAHEKSLVFEISVNSEANKASFEQSSDPNCYYFPDDKVTQLLNLYGHNRCLNGFVAEPVPKEE